MTVEVPPETLLVVQSWPADVAVIPAVTVEADFVVLEGLFYNDRQTPQVFL